MSVYQFYILSKIVILNTLSLFISYFYTKVASLRFRAYNRYIKYWFFVTMHMIRYFYTFYIEYFVLFIPIFSCFFYPFLNFIKINYIDHYTPFYFFHFNSAMNFLPFFDYTKL